LPASIQLAHAFEQHEEIICSEDVEHHFHQDTIECFLCHLQADSSAILPRAYVSTTIKKTVLTSHTKYTFLTNHQQLSFSLRGPPIF